ncbi:hypothetical protein Tco_0231781 [Tanacetum coccineum]
MMRINVFNHKLLYRCLDSNDAKVLKGIKSNSSCRSNLPLKVGFPEFFKELEAEILGAGAQLIGLQFLQLELRLGKTPSRSFRPVKSAEIFMQLGFSPFGASLSKIVLGARGALLVVEG